MVPKGTVIVKKREPCIIRDPVSCWDRVRRYNDAVMGKPRRTAVQKYHDRVASRYDQSYTDGYWQWHDALTWDYIKPFLPTNANAEVVDLGCGTGKWGAKLARSGFAVTFVDISAKMVDQARTSMAAAASDERFLQADLCDLAKLPDDHFALAVALGDPIGCARSPLAALKEIRRILAHDGRLIATFDNRLAALDFLLETGTAKDMVRFLRDGKTHWLTRDVDEQFPIFTYSPGDLAKLLPLAGFIVEDIVGKTVLPMRKYRHALETSQDRRTWARIEKRLCRDSAAMGRASHLQVVCRANKR